MARPLGYALVGSGEFGKFCLKQFQELDAIDPKVVVDQNEDAAKAAAEPFGLATSRDLTEVLRDPAIDIIHLATPPFTHAKLATQCLEAGKHVLCEKPLATELGEGRAMLALAEKSKRVLTVNLVMRYDPLNTLIDQILKEKLLGEPIAGSVLNLAGDTKLPPGHWFWDRQKSGGIFVEHGVHFFDLFETWLGRGEVVAAQQSIRPGETTLVDQVRCVVRHKNTGGGVLVDHYHGFHQSAAMDRQETRLICERGDFLIRGWLSENFTIDALLPKSAAERIRELAGDWMTGLSVGQVDPKLIKARNRVPEVDGRYRIDVKLPMPKPELYGNTIRELMADQVAYIHDPSHMRRVTEANGLRSLEIAVAARALAER